jgi:hypothetical protein
MKLTHVSLGLPEIMTKYAPVLALGVVFQFALNHVDHDFVTDQAALVHDLLGLPSELSLLRDLGPQHVSGGLARKLLAAQLLKPEFRVGEHLPDGTRSTSP